MKNFLRSSIALLIGVAIGIVITTLIISPGSITSKKGPNVGKLKFIDSSYDLYTHNDTIWLLDGDRLVANIGWGRDKFLDSVIIDDNQ